MCAAYPDRLAVRGTSGGSSRKVTFALAGGTTVRLLDDGDPLAQVRGREGGLVGHAQISECVWGGGHVGLVGQAGNG